MSADEKSAQRSRFVASGKVDVADQPFPWLEVGKVAAVRACL